MSNPAPGGHPANAVLLTDGRVLVSGPECSTSWWTLTPDSTGSYQHGTWTAVGSSILGRVLAPSAILKDGRYLLCGGEYVGTPQNCGGPGDQSACEIFDPTTNAWSTAPDMPELVKDTESSMLGDGRVLFRSKSSQDTYAFNEWSLGSSAVWTQQAAVPASIGDPEGVSALLQDGSVFMGGAQFARYLPAMNQWFSVATTPGQASGEFLAINGSDEIGPSLLLHDGRVLVLGGNAHNGLYTPPSTPTGLGSWVLAHDTPTNGSGFQYNLGDTPSAVEPNGKVLTLLSTDQSGAGGAPPAAYYEYDPSADSWSAISTPESEPVVYVDRFRLLLLPNGKSTHSGQVFVSGFNTGDIFLFTPSTDPNSAWRPTIISISPLTFGRFILVGTQLNGLTTGADLGDDAKLNTNYPIVSLVNSAGSVFFARTFDVDQMAPRPATQGSCGFQPPANLPAGTYTVRVSANGVTSGNTWSLTLPQNDIGPAELPPLVLSAAL